MSDTHLLSCYVEIGFKGKCNLKKEQTLSAHRNSLQWKQLEIHSVALHHLKRSRNSVT